VLASACKALPAKSEARALSLIVEGVVNTPAMVLLRAQAAPRSAQEDRPPNFLMDTLGLGRQPGVSPLPVRFNQLHSWATP
jgi:hypothetical protein